MQMNTEASLREYLKVNVKVPVIGRIGPLARAFDFVANAAPGVKEILTVGKVCWELRESLAGRADWDLIVVDAAATGHVIGQLDAPREIRSWCTSGRCASRPTGWSSCCPSPPLLNVVTVPEEMPVNETIDGGQGAAQRRAARRGDREPGAPGVVHARRRSGVRRAAHGGCD